MFAYWVLSYQSKHTIAVTSNVTTFSAELLGYALLMELFRVWFSVDHGLRECVCLLQAMADTNIVKIQVELHKEIKKNANPRPLRAALWRFAELCHLIRWVTPYTRITVLEFPELCNLIRWVALHKDRCPGVLWVLPPDQMVGTPTQGNLFFPLRHSSQRWLQGWFICL